MCGTCPFLVRAARDIGNQGYGAFPMETTIVFAHLAATLVMCGVIWFVQLVHYPLLSVVPVESAAKTALEHQRRTTWVVAAPMAVEGVTVLSIFFSPPDGVSWWLPWVGGALLAVALGSTVFLSVPRHTRMAARPDAAVGRELVVTNWPRTLAWTLRGAVAVTVALQWAQHQRVG